ncbi:MAG: hypothetical protein AW06_002117 [Candidatus Accumulibacter cognatus]|uniref:Uncharacterized protein n=1 Tax=Candidatus Accumulibacter cognatus TaxID=2954383 RepID=A0A080M8J6_9PROT|nr:MAG: hypothetical protein AW06_002117 [Candidatus Accumulibacter cognatus]
MRTFDLARTDGWIQRQCAGVVQLVESVGEIATGDAHRSLRVIDRCGFEVPFHLCNHLAGLSQQESRLLGGHPILGRIRRADLAGGGQIFADVEPVDQDDSLITEQFFDLAADPGRSVANTVNLGLGAQSQRIDQPLQDGTRFPGTLHRHAGLRNCLALPLCDTDLRFSPVRALRLAGVRSARHGLDNGYHRPSPPSAASRCSMGPPPAGNLPPFIHRPPVR